MNHKFYLFLVFLLSACTPEAVDVDYDDTAKVTNIILLIGDGVGVAYWTAARYMGDTLAIERMPVAGLVDTRAATTRVTDSAAGATAYATGVRTGKGAVGVGPRCGEIRRRNRSAVRRNPASCDRLETVLEIAKQLGMATGLVATSSITDGTPASFAAHVPNRSMQSEIATQLASSSVDVLLGGGRGFFDGSLRSDSSNLLAQLCRTATCLFTITDLIRYRPDDRRLIGLFTQEHMEPVAWRETPLAEMTWVALSKLSRNPQGFFLVVEGSQPDFYAHDNAPLPEIVAEVIDFDQAIEVALDFARSNPGTLVVVTSDHETGGLSLVEKDGRLKALYNTTDHTAEMVPIFASGPRARRFGGIKNNDEIGRMLIEIVRSRR